MGDPRGFENGNGSLLESAPVGYEVSPDLRKAVEEAYHDTKEDSENVTRAGAVGRQVAATSELTRELDIERVLVDLRKVTAAVQTLRQNRIELGR